MVGWEDAILEQRQRRTDTSMCVIQTLAQNDEGCPGIMKVLSPPSNSFLIENPKKCTYKCSQFEQTRNKWKYTNIMILAVVLPNLDIFRELDVGQNPNSSYLTNTGMQPASCCPWFLSENMVVGPSRGLYSSLYRYNHID